MTIELLSELIKPKQVDLTTADTAKPDHTFDISGFKPANVFFLTSDREVALQEGKTQFRAVLQV